MEPSEPRHPFHDLLLPRWELLGGLATALGLGLLLGYGHFSLALAVGLLALAGAFFLRVFLPTPPAMPAAAAAFGPVAPPAGYPALVADKIQGIASATTLVGVAYKLGLWHGSAPLLLAGTVTLLPVVAYQAVTGRLTWRPLLALGLGLAAGLAFAPLTRYAYRDDPALAARILYQQAHPRDTTARAEVQRLLRARRQRR